ncbi:uncharacterized protein PAC_03279 [Phialocephala subalpina]|uniref:Acyltransferase 3 domain-containing protein n=1 Tax=Phialocephala subalpina TaxID=576137 RepID=A0A1L7WKU8_9HELO|nr:uncharacterized protein PAC_03279 [Phialocephala subalpina]
MGIFLRLYQFLPSRASTSLGHYELLSTNPGDSPPTPPRDDIEADPHEPKSTTATSTTYSKALSSWAVETAWKSAFFLVPSFLAPYIDRHHQKVERRITETTYLNGIRGLAASLVYIQHVGYETWIHWGYGSRPSETYFIQRPLIRVIYSGRFMVAIFFILSGYVLSYKPLQLARKHDSGALFVNLSSAVFRRTPRLFLPVVPIMIGTATIVYFGCYGDGNFTQNSCYERESSIWTQYTDYIPIFIRMINPSVWDEYFPPTVEPLWTLPMEFRGSMVVFLAVCSLGNIRPLPRISCMILLAGFLLHIGRWDTFLFICGSVLAELRIFRNQASSLYNFESLYLLSPKTSIIWKTFNAIFWITALITSLWIGSWPARGASNSPGFRTLFNWTPNTYNNGYHSIGDNDRLVQCFWVSLSALLLLLSFEHLSFLQKPFDSALAAYVGDISFSFYIVHWTMLHTVGQSIIGTAMRWWPGGRGAGVGYPTGFFVGVVLTTPVVVWVADVYWRAFDLGAVRTSRWLNGKCVRNLA